MSAGSRILYNVGKVFNFISIFFLVIGVILFGISITNEELINKMATDMAREAALIKNALLFILVVTIVELVVQIIIVFIAFRATSALKHNTGAVASHIMMLVISIVGLQLFYFIGSIFGLVAANEVRNAPAEDKAE